MIAHPNSTHWRPAQLGKARSPAVKREADEDDGGGEGSEERRFTDPETRLASRPSGPWNDDDYDVLADGVVIGSIFNAKTAPVGRAVDVDVAIPAQQGPHANTRL
jgi:hypothetical protein